ncbi:MAG: DUF4831 family protein [Rikenellaceae bacterium]
MNKYILTFLLSLLSTFSFAQGYLSTRMGFVKDGDTYSLSYPTTTISVELLIEEEVVTPGIYARYAQKYLALRAPLVASTTYTVIDATISLPTAQDSVVPLRPSDTIIEYSNLPVDQYSMIVLNPDDAAREAATAIFTIRRQRRDIINGEAGEGYFGAGLKDAMDRLDAMEQEYLELFMGYKTVSQSTKRYTFNPQEDSNRYVFARFDPKVGVLPANDLTGAPIYIQFTPQAIPDTSSMLPTKKSRGTIWFRIAAPTQCILYNDSQALTSTVLPIYELGKSVEIDTLAK